MLAFPKLWLWCTWCLVLFDLSCVECSELPKCKFIFLTQFGSLVFQTFLPLLCLFLEFILDIYWITQYYPRGHWRYDIFPNLCFPSHLQIGSFLLTCLLITDFILYHPVVKPIWWFFSFISETVLFKSKISFLNRFSFFTEISHVHSL